MRTIFPREDGDLKLAPEAAVNAGLEFPKYDD